jgi:hypothetical protein
MILMQNVIAECVNHGIDIMFTEGFVVLQVYCFWINLKKIASSPGLDHPMVFAQIQAMSSVRNEFH